MNEMLFAQIKKRKKQKRKQKKHMGVARNTLHLDEPLVIFHLQNSLYFHTSQTIDVFYLPVHDLWVNR